MIGSSVAFAFAREVVLLDAARFVQGVCLTMLGALLYGTLNVLAPLRLGHLGAGAVTVGAAFLAGAAAAAVVSPLVGRMADRRGRRMPALAGLVASALWAPLLPVPWSEALLFVWLSPIRCSGLSTRPPAR
jgi:MFS family permease